MEKSKNRIEYLNDLEYFLKNVKLTDKLLIKIKSHKYFKSYKKPLEELRSDDISNDKKLFILLELTRERATCAAIVKILREFEQKEVADRLEAYNTSDGPMDLSTEVQLEVAKGAVPILGRSNTYTLHKDPRGKCIIINNVEDQQTPDIYDDKGNHIYTPKGLKRETIRFEYVFTQLHFDVKVLTNLSAKQMEEQLTNISKDKSLENDEAFVLIVISHGQDKKVLGYNACEAMRKISFGKLKEDDLEAQQEMESDSLKIKDVVQIFAEENCPQLISKPKLFFFICCRNKDIKRSDKANDSNYAEKQMKSEDFKENVLKNGKPVRNLDTFVSYSCAQGFESNYSIEWGMSYFGLAFTQSIAQYAGDESLQGIMNRTSERLKKMFEELKQKESETIGKNTTKSCITIGSFAIEVNTYAMGRQLYFNPGFNDNKTNPQSL